MIFESCLVNLEISITYTWNCFMFKIKEKYFKEATKLWYAHVIYEFVSYLSLCQMNSWKKKSSNASNASNFWQTRYLFHNGTKNIWKSHSFPFFKDFTRYLLIFILKVRLSVYVSGGLLCFRQLAQQSRQPCYHTRDINRCPSH